MTTCIAPASHHHRDSHRTDPSQEIPSCCFVLQRRLPGGLGARCWPRQRLRPRRRQRRAPLSDSSASNRVYTDVRRASASRRLAPSRARPRRRGCPGLGSLYLGDRCRRGRSFGCVRCRRWFLGAVRCRTYPRRHKHTWNTRRTRAAHAMRRRGQGGGATCADRSRR